MTETGKSICKFFLGTVFFRGLVQDIRGIKFPNRKRVKWPSICANREIIYGALVYQCNGQEMFTLNRCLVLNLVSDTV